MNQITPDAHSSLIGGSTAARRIGCPRSYALEQMLPPTKDEGSEYAREGTALHELMAVALERDVEPTTLLPFKFTHREGWFFTVTHALWEEKGEPALTAFDAFIDAQERRLNAKARFLIETRVQFPGIPDGFGTSDIIAQIGPELFVLDWKFGNGIVPAEENKQLMFYAAGALSTCADWFDGIDFGDDTTPVTMVILQPARENCIDIWPTDLGRLNSYEVEVHSAIQTIKEMGREAPIQDGPWCKFAKCKMVCPLHIGAAAKLAAKFDKLKQAVSGGERINDWGSRWAELLELAELVEPFVKEIKDEAHRAAEGGMKIPGWGLDMKKAGGRKWASDESDVEVFLKGHLDEEAIWKKSLVTMPQAEKLLKAKGIEVPEDMVEKPKAEGTKLVRADKIKEPPEGVSNRIAALAAKLATR